MWNVTGYDWTAPPAAVIEQKVSKQIRGGDVILLHDGGHKELGADRAPNSPGDRSPDRKVQIGGIRIRYDPGNDEEKHSDILSETSFVSRMDLCTSPHRERSRAEPTLLRPSQFPYPRTAANASFAAAIVRCTSSSECAVPRNAASYCEGGRYTPLSSMLRKNFPNASVFDFDAESQSVTGPGWKNHVNIDPTRLWQSATPASFAAAATPSTSSAAQLLQPRINLALPIPQLLQHRAPRRHRQRIPRKRPRLIHRPQRRHQIHNLLRPAVRAHRQPSANNFPHRRQVRTNVVKFLRSPVSHTKSRHHFIKNQHRPFPLRQQPQPHQIIVRRGNASHVPDHRLHNHASNLVLVFLERMLDHRKIVERQAPA